MYQSKLSQRSLRSALLLGAASIVAVGAAGTANADTVETVVVTGSLIPTPNATSNSPIQTVGAETIDLSARANVEDIVNTQPQIVSGFNKFSNNPGGISTVDLRGLGAGRVLVLVDGVRAMPGGPNNLVDIETIPAPLVDHIDLVSGGGSATYGSDAISGVINFVLKKDFEGFEANLRYGQEINHGFAPEKDANIVMGVNTADGKGNVTIFGEYYKRNGVFQGQDPHFAIDLANGSSRGPSGALANGSEGFSSLSMGSAPGCTASSTRYSFKANGDPEGYCNKMQPQPLDPAANAFAIAHGRALSTGGDRFNFAPLNYLVVPETRATLYGTGHYEIFDGVEAYGNIEYVNNTVTTILAPSPVLAQGAFSPQIYADPNCRGVGTRPGNANPLCDPDFFGAGTHNPNLEGYTSYVTPLMQSKIDERACNFAIGAAVVATQAACLAAPIATIAPFYTNVGFGTFNTGGAPGTGVTLGFQIPLVWRTTQFGGRVGTLITDEYQVNFGLKGQFGSFFGGWDWNAYYMAGSVNVQNTIANNMQPSHFENAMQSCPAGSAPHCVPMDIFGFGNLTPDMIDFLSYTGRNTINYERQIAHAETHGDLWDLTGAGAVQVALGAEYRKDAAAFNADAAAQQFDIIGFSPAKSTVGSYTVSEFFGETRIPLLSGMEFAEYLGLDAGVRFSHYNTGAGDVTTFKAGGEYQPIDDVRFRVMWQRAIRAPNVSELFLGGVDGAPSYTDPCAWFDPSGAPLSPSAAQQTACTNMFAAAGQVYPNHTLVQQNSQMDGVAFGNTQLTPEVSNTFTVGAVITPSFLDGVTASVDYTHIAVANFVGLKFGSANTALNDCINNFNGTGTTTYQLLNNPGTANACDYVTRLSDGSPQSSLPLANFNAGAVKVGSIDLQLTAQHDLADLLGEDGDMGSLDLAYGATIMTQWIDPSLGPVVGGSIAGGLTATYTGEIIPRYRHNVALGYTMGDWRATLNWEYIGHLPNMGAGAAPNNFNLPAYNLFGLAVRWAFSENYSATVTVNNLLDTKPHYAAYINFGQTNALCSAYDCLGREVAVELTAKL